MLVLVVALLLALAALSLTFTVTLDGLAARNAQQAALAEGQAEGAVELAAKVVVGSAAAAAPGAPSAPPTELGPWPDAGIPVLVDAVAHARGVYELEARARVGSSTVRRLIIVDARAAGAPVVRARP